MQEAFGNGTWGGRFSRGGDSRLIRKRRGGIGASLADDASTARSASRIAARRYMVAASAMEFHGVPIDVQTLALLREYWTDIEDQLISDIDATYGVSTATVSAPIVGLLGLLATTFLGPCWRVAA